MQPGRTLIDGTQTNPFGLNGLVYSMKEIDVALVREPAWERVRTFLVDEHAGGESIEVAALRYGRWRRRWTLALHEPIASFDRATVVMRELYRNTVLILRVRRESPRLAALLAPYVEVEKGRFSSPADPVYFKQPFPWPPTMMLAGSQEGFLLVQHDAHIALLLHL